MKTYSLILLALAAVPALSFAQALPDDPEPTPLSPVQYPSIPASPMPVGPSDAAWVRFQQIANGQRCAGFAENAPRVILVKRLHFASRFEILRLGVGRSGNVGRPTELLPRRILHAEDPIVRHRLTL